MSKYVYPAEEYAEDLDAALAEIAAEKAAQVAADPPEDEAEADGTEEAARESWGIWDLPINPTRKGDDAVSAWLNPEAKKKATKNKHKDEHDPAEFARRFPGFAPLRYPAGYPRAEWDEPKVYDERNPPGPSYTGYNYCTGEYFWHFAALETAPEVVQRECHPQGLTVAEERAAGAARRAAHTGPVGALKTKRASRPLFPPIAPR